MKMSRPAEFAGFSPPGPPGLQFMMQSIMFRYAKWGIIWNA
jgi:hypothetical protein